MQGPGRTPKADEIITAFFAIFLPGLVQFAAIGAFDFGLIIHIILVASIILFYSEMFSVAACAIWRTCGAAGEEYINQNRPAELLICGTPADPHPSAR
jgi:uncharacterized membrane protein YqaE (UPF0057 family)